jgi:predicted Fe-S protein YdhL (DUF1289 family)
MPSLNRVPTPCTGACRYLVGQRLCLGCGRTFEEITAWATMTPPRRAAVWERLAAEGRPDPNTSARIEPPAVPSP